MRTADIKVGGHYAYSRARNSNLAQEVEVLETGLYRQVWHGYGFSKGKSDKADGVKVRFVGRGDRDNEVVPAYAIKSTWAEYAEAKAAREASEAAAAAAKKELRARFENVVKVLGLEFDQFRYRTAYPTTYALTIEELESLVTWEQEGIQ